MTATAETRPLVSIVTVFHNRAGHVRASLQSLVMQTYPDIEILAVDDGSTDGTLGELQRFADDPRVIIVAKQNSGFTSTMREAIARARGSLIAVHGSGDISYPERIARQVAVLTQQPDVGVVGCHLLTPVAGQNRSKRIGRPNGLDFRTELLRGNMFTHGEVMYRKGLYEAVGGYRAAFVLGQDLDLWLRMSRMAGYWIVQDILYQRAELPNGVSTSPEKVLRQQRFTELARQCAEAVDAGQADPVERHGADALALMRRSRRLADRLALNGLRVMINGGDAAAGCARSSAMPSCRSTGRHGCSSRLSARPFSRWVGCASREPLNDAPPTQGQTCTCRLM